MFLLLLIPLIEPAPEIVQVDLIELNHVRCQGQKLDQFIFWDFNEYWRRDYGWYVQSEVVAWVMAKSPARFDHRRRLWIVEVEWIGRRVRVEAKSYQETTTNFDPELDQRHLLPVSRRRGLR